MAFVQGLDSIAYHLCFIVSMYLKHVIVKQINRKHQQLSYLYRTGQRIQSDTLQWWDPGNIISDVCVIAD